MEEIRLRSIAGYKVLPKVGAGVGGLLLGDRDGAGVRVLSSVDMPCSHRFGPGFVLTPHEKSQVREMVRELDPVGWYFSVKSARRAAAASGHSAWRTMARRVSPWRAGWVMLVTGMGSSFSGFKIGKSP